MVWPVLALGGSLLFVRTATVEVSPPELLPLGGYTARKGVLMEPGGGPLYARAIDVDGETIVAVDMLTVPRGFFEEVAKRAGGRPPWIVATHTHCAPDSQMLNPRMTFAVPGIASFAPRWFDWYASRVALAVREAREGRPQVVSCISLVRTRVRLNHGRRPLARPDETAWLVRADGEPLLAVYAAHATFHEEDWNTADGDWPGLLGARLECPVLPGAIGDVAPSAPGHGPVEKSRRFVEKFVSAVEAAPSTVVCSARSPHVAWTEPIHLDAPVPHPEFSRAYAVPEALSQVLVTRFAEERAEVRLLRWGKLLLVGVPGEPTAEIGRQIQARARRAGFPHCIVVSHVDGWVGYILEPADYDRGRYEATLSFNGRLTGQRLLEAVERGLRSVPVPDQPDPLALSWFFQSR